MRSMVALKDYRGLNPVNASLGEDIRLCETLTKIYSSPWCALLPYSGLGEDFVTVPKVWPTL